MEAMVRFAIEVSTSAVGVVLGVPAETSSTSDIFEAGAKSLG